MRRFGKKITDIMTFDVDCHFTKTNWNACQHGWTHARNEVLILLQDTQEEGAFLIRKSHIPHIIVSFCFAIDLMLFKVIC